MASHPVKWGSNGTRIEGSDVDDRRKDIENPSIVQRANGAVGHEWSLSRSGEPGIGSPAFIEARRSA